MYLLLWLCLGISPLLATRIDPSLTSFEQRQREHRVDVYDFAGEYPHLTKIDIDARRKKCVELQLTGDYPVLEKILYEGGFGSLEGNLTGQYPVLKTAQFLCGNAAMQLNFQGQWEKSCRISIRGGTETVHIKLPESVGVTARVRSKLGAKIDAGPLQKQVKWWHMTDRTYANSLAQTAEIVLHLDIEVGDAQVVFEN